MNGSPRSQSLQLELLTRDNLLERPQLLRDIVNLVNTTYLDHERLFTEQLRFDDEWQLPSELGSDGLCAVLLDATGNGDATPVATASTRPCSKAENDGESHNGAEVLLTYRVTPN